MNTRNLTPEEDRFSRLCGERSTRFYVTETGYRLERFTRPSTNGTADWRAYRPAENDPPLLTVTVDTLDEARDVLVSWTGVARDKLL